MIYCAFEGGHGYKGRIEAIRRHYGINDDVDVPLYVMPGQVDLIADEKALVEEFRYQLGTSFLRSWCWTPSTAVSPARRAATRI